MGPPTLHPPTPQGVKPPEPPGDAPPLLSTVPRPELPSLSDSEGTDEFQTTGTASDRKVSTQTSQQQESANSSGVVASSSPMLNFAREIAAHAAVKDPTLELSGSPVLNFAREIAATTQEPARKPPGTSDSPSNRSAELDFDALFVRRPSQVLSTSAQDLNRMDAAEVASSRPQPPESGSGSAPTSVPSDVPRLMQPLLPRDRQAQPPPPKPTAEQQQRLAELRRRRVQNDRDYKRKHSRHAQSAAPDDGDRHQAGTGSGA